MVVWRGSHYCTTKKEKTAGEQKKRNDFDSANSLSEKYSNLGKIFALDEAENDEYEFVYDED